MLPLERKQNWESVEKGDHQRDHGSHLKPIMAGTLGLRAEGPWAGMQVGLWKAVWTREVESNGSPRGNLEECEPHLTNKTSGPVEADHLSGGITGGIFFCFIFSWFVLSLPSLTASLQFYLPRWQMQSWREALLKPRLQQPLLHFEAFPRTRAAALFCQHWHLTDLLPL